VASGVSCRHQIADFTSARALHPAELLAPLACARDPFLEGLPEEPEETA
jgi:hypothetical protein